MAERYQLQYLHGAHYEDVVREARRTLRLTPMLVRLAVEHACSRCHVSTTHMQRMRIEDDVYEREAYSRTGESRERLEQQWNGRRL